MIFFSSPQGPWQFRTGREHGPHTGPNLCRRFSTLRVFPHLPHFSHLSFSRLVQFTQTGSLSSVRLPTGALPPHFLQILCSDLSLNRQFEHLSSPVLRLLETYFSSPQNAQRPNRLVPKAWPPFTIYTDLKRLRNIVI